MAQLQGYFLLHKEDPDAALAHLQSIANSQFHHSPESQHHRLKTSQPPIQIPRREAGRRLTAFDLDKMPFNPQNDWEKDVQK